MPHVKLGVQLAHAGRKASAQRPWKGGGPLTGADAPDLPWTTVSASALPYDPAAKWHTPVPLDEVGLQRVKAAFVEGVERSLRLGFDVIELHGAHGYCLHQFLSPLSNQRSDAYGGTMEKRRRFPLEVFEACRKLVPADKALGIRLSATDWVEGGLTIEDTIGTAKHLKALGCDFVDVSSGGNSPQQKITVVPGYHVPFSARIRKEGRRQDLGGGRHHRARAGRADHRGGGSRLYRPCPRLPARSALGMECRPGAWSRNAALATSRGAGDNYPAVQASAQIGRSGRIRPINGGLPAVPAADVHAERVVG